MIRRFYWMGFAVGVPAGACLFLTIKLIVEVMGK
jgi:hypothetical protein